MRKNESVSTTDDNSSAFWAIVASYGSLAIAIVAEIYAVDFIEGHIAGFAGVVVTWIAFVIGGVLLAVLAASKTKQGQKIRDPLYGLCGWLCRRLKAWGFVISTGLIAGAMSVSPYYKSIAYPHRVRLMFVGAALYATIWLVILPLLIPVMQMVPLVGRFF